MEQENKETANFDYIYCDQQQPNYEYNTDSPIEFNELTIPCDLPVPNIEPNE